MKDLTKIVMEYPVHYKQGFTNTETLQLCEQLGIDPDLYYEKLGVNTCLLIDNQTVTYHEDVLLALRCCIENRDKYLYEWD